MSPRRVLVVDDSPLCARLLSIALTQAGFAVSIAKSVPGALAELQRGMPHAIVCDMLLGTSGNGYDVISAVRKSGSKIRCIALTGCIGHEIEGHSLTLGFDFFLRKPISPKRIVELLECG